MQKDHIASSASGIHFRCREPVGSDKRCVDIVKYVGPNFTDVLSRFGQNMTLGNLIIITHYELHSVFLCSRNEEGLSCYK